MPNLKRKMYFKKHCLKLQNLTQVIFSIYNYNIQPPTNNLPSKYFESHFRLQCTYIYVILNFD